MAELATALGEHTGRPLTYRDPSESDFAAMLVSRGYPGPVAEFFAQTDTASSHGALFDDSRTLSTLIGRPTTPLRVSIERSIAITTV